MDSPVGTKYTPYHDESARYAVELCKGSKDQLEQYKRIIRYISRTVAYDYIKAISVAKVKLKEESPDIERCWEKRLGICYDIAALTHNMLRAVGIKSSVCIGKADRQNHAWNEVIIDGRKHRYDFSGKASRYFVKLRITQ